MIVHIGIIILSLCEQNKKGQAINVRQLPCMHIHNRSSKVWSITKIQYKENNECYFLCYASYDWNA